jgi:TorA maturation chaperone TorD
MVDHELSAFRHGYYGLFVSLLWREPTGALLDALAAEAPARVRPARRVEPRLAEGWNEIAAFLAREGAGAAEAVGDEYLRLFVGPAAPEVNLYESWYLTGRVFDRPLADVRTFLARAGIEKDPAYAEPEDFLGFELEIMRTLVGREAVAEADERSVRELQNEFLKRHLLVWGPAAVQDLAAAPAARFYRGLSLLLGGFLETELEVCRGWSNDPVLDLGERRELHGRSKVFRGPVIDFQPSVPTEPEQP